MSVFRGIALTVTLAGAAGSLACMFHVGSRQRSLLLIALFTFWVASPFVGLLSAAIVSTRWPSPTRVTLYSAMLVITIGSLAIYGRVAFGAPMAKPASMFLIVPLASWVVIAMAALVYRPAATCS